MNSVRRYVEMSPLERVAAARANPASFVSFVLTDGANWPLARSQLHDDLHEFLSAHRKALVELPRDHGKSVQVCGRILWELGRNPSLRVKLVCATDALAAERSRFLRDAIATSERLDLVFPHLKPASPWTAEAFTVRRPAEGIGPSVAAFGVGAGSTGARADLLVCDDIVDVRSLHCPGERRRVRDYFHNNLMNLLEPDGRFWGLFTPWHPDDLNAHLKAGGQFPLFRRAVGPDLEPVWEEKWDRAKLTERRAEIGEASFARGYRLVTVSEGEVLIRPEWVRFADPPPRSACEAVVLAVDPAVSEKERADRSALVVAGVTGPGCVGTGNAVTGLPGTGNAVTGCSVTYPVTAFPVPEHPVPTHPVYVQILHAVARRVRTPELVELIDALDRQWQPDVIRFESNAAFAGIRDLLVHRTRFGAKVVGKAETRSKDARIAALSVAVQNGCVRLAGQGGGGDPGQRELFDELTGYPFATHDDLADATAAAVEHLLHRPQPRAWV